MAIRNVVCTPRDSLGNDTGVNDALKPMIQPAIPRCSASHGSAIGEAATLNVAIAGVRLNVPAAETVWSLFF
jgi:hypothetical protein